MSTTSRTASPSPRTAGPRPVAADRRRRQRLRDLCDEVIASYRVARDEDLFSERDRREARALLPRLEGGPAGRRADGPTGRRAAQRNSRCSAASAALPGQSRS